jgi:phosphatidylglycerophosphate synthase
VWFAWAIIIREAIIGVGALGIAAKARAKLDVRQLGKIATALLYLSVAWYFVGKGSDFDPLIWLAWAAGLPGLILYYIVGFQYLQDALGLLKNSDE